MTLLTGTLRNRRFRYCRLGAAGGLFTTMCHQPEHPWMKTGSGERGEVSRSAWRAGCLSEAGAGEALLLIHGMAGSSATWRAVLPQLSKKYRVVAPDLFGHGESARPKLRRVLSDDL